MLVIESTSEQFVYVPVTSSLNADLSVFDAEMALVPQDQVAPAEADWLDGGWVAPRPGALKEVAVLRDPVVWPDGEYMAFVRLHVPPETVVLRSGRVRIGDTRATLA